MRVDQAGRSRNSLCVDHGVGPDADAVTDLFENAVVNPYRVGLPDGRLELPGNQGADVFYQYRAHDEQDYIK